MEETHTQRSEEEPGVEKSGNLGGLAIGTVVIVLSIVAYGIHAVFGSLWLHVLGVLIAVPVLFWSVAALRGRYTRFVATRLGFAYAGGFPSIPAGSPAHGRYPAGFTGYTLSSRGARATINVYEQSYQLHKSSEGAENRNPISRAHGVWWQYGEDAFPAFEVRRRTTLEPVFSAMASTLGRVVPFIGSSRNEIVIEGDHEFSRCFVVFGDHDDQVLEFLTPELRRILVNEMDRGSIGGSGSVLAWDQPGRLWGSRALQRMIARGDRLRRACESAAWRMR
jgi:hypothetical protein